MEAAVIKTIQLPHFRLKWEENFINTVSEHGGFIEEEKRKIARLYISVGGATVDWQYLLFWGDDI